MNNPLNGLMRETILKNAAKAMAQWIVQTQTSADDLAQRLNQGEPVLDDALATIPRDQIGGVRAMVAPLIKTFNQDDYAKVLDYLWEYESARAHAILLKQSDMFWHHFYPAMEKVKVWLATGSPG